MPGQFKNTGALNGNLSAPPTFGGTPAPITGDTGASGPRILSAVNSDSTRVSSNASEQAVSVLHTAVVILISAMVLLWVLGGIVFRNANI